MNTNLSLEEFILSHYCEAKVLGEHMADAGILDPVGLVKVSSHLALAHAIVGSKTVADCMPKRPRSAVIRELAAHSEALQTHASFVKIFHSGPQTLPAEFTDSLLPHYLRALDTVLNFWESDSKRIAEGRTSVGTVLADNGDFVAAVAPDSVVRLMRFLNRFPQILALANIANLSDPVPPEAYSAHENLLQAESLRFAQSTIGATHLYVLSAFDTLYDTMAAAERSRIEKSRHN